ncbi:hypothetical protein ACLBWZ_16555 [Brucellaceae bacterium C25G]
MAAELPIWRILLAGSPLSGDYINDVGSTLMLFKTAYYSFFCAI